MSKQLSDTQLVILSAACQRDRARVLPITASLKGGAVNMVLRSLHTRGLIEAFPAEAGDEVWTEQDGAALTLRATKAAFESLGIDPPASVAEVPLAVPVADNGATAKRSKTGREPAPREPAPKRAKSGSSGPAPTTTPRTGTKQELLIGLLRRPEGASLDEIIAATGWLPHTVRGAIAGALKKRLGLEVVSEKAADRGRVYRIAK